MCLGTDKQKIAILRLKQLSGFKLDSILRAGLCLKLEPRLQLGQTFLTWLVLPESKSLGLCWGSSAPVPGVWAGGSGNWNNLSLLQTSGLDLLRSKLDAKTPGMCLYT